MYHFKRIPLVDISSINASYSGLRLHSAKESWFNLLMTLNGVVVIMIFNATVKRM